MNAVLRHAGILVKNLEEAKEIYSQLGFREVNREKLEVLKMQDEAGNLIELVCGNWHPHIAVNWFDDGQGNYIEEVKG